MRRSAEVLLRKIAVMLSMFVLCCPCIARCLKEDDLDECSSSPALLRTHQESEVTKSIMTRTSTLFVGKATFSATVEVTFN
jgi:hypothetical protein